MSLKEKKLKNSSLIKKALYFAAEKHDGQYRKGGRVPYIVHPVQVALGVSKYTNDEKIIAVAFLHDVIEDCPDVSISLLRKEFGGYIAQLVDEVSLLKKKQYATWKEKKLEYLEKIKHASKNALIIVAVDKMNNLQAYFNALKKEGKASMRDFRGTPDEYRWYYTEIENILVSRLGKHSVVKDYIKTWKLYKK